MPTSSPAATPRQAQDLQLARAQQAFLSALRNNEGRFGPVHNVADLLERGHKARSPAAAMLLDVLA